MIFAHYPIQGKPTPVQVGERITTPEHTWEVLIFTRDGSKPFTAPIARIDPEETPCPDTLPVNWTWVGWNELTDIQCSHAHVELCSTGGFHFGPDGPSDDIQESVYCYDCDQTFDTLEPVAVREKLLTEVDA